MIRRGKGGGDAHSLEMLEFGVTDAVSSGVPAAEVPNNLSEEVSHLGSACNHVSSIRYCSNDQFRSLEQDTISLLHVGCIGTFAPM